MTYIIKRKEIEEMLDMKSVIDAVENAFLAYGNGKVQMPPKSYLYFEKYNGDLRSMPAYVEDIDIAGVKCVNVHPDNRTLPSVMATIILVDPQNGYPLAVMDGTYITAMRTGAVGAIAAKYLSKRNSQVAGFIGAGHQAETQLEGLVNVRDIKLVMAYDIDEKKRTNFCEMAAEKYHLQAIALNDVKEDLRQCDIIVTTTPSRKPILEKGCVSAGTHINAIGADAKGKQELESLLVRDSIVVVDNLEQASHSGEINVPVSEGIISEGDVYELSEVITGRKIGRSNNNEITVFDSTGLAIQDIATANLAYKKLISGNNALSKLDLF